MEAAAEGQTPTRPTRWPSPTRSSAVSSGKAARRSQKSGAAVPLLRRQLPNASQTIGPTQKIPPKLETGTICHIVLPVTAVNIRMICDTRVQQRNKHWPIMWIMFISQANQRGNDPDLELRGQGRAGQPRPNDHHQWKLRVRRPRSISHQHEVSGNVRRRKGFGPASSSFPFFR